MPLLTLTLRTQQVGKGTNEKLSAIQAEPSILTASLGTIRSVNALKTNFKSNSITLDKPHQSLSGDGAQVWGRGGQEQIV